MSLLQNTVLALLGGFALNSLIMVVCFRFARRINNYSIVDSAWALSFLITAWFYSALSPAFPERRLLVLIPVSFWSLRLGLHLFVRIKGHHPKEDGRYLMLRERYTQAKGVEHGFFWFFQYQAWSVVLLSAPFLIPMMNPNPGLFFFEWLGIGIFAVGLLGETIADLQVSSFRTRNPGKTCDQGLWRYSRHPNYFFECVIWIGFFTIALGSPLGWISGYAPLLILHLVLNVTGIPYAESQSLKSRGDEYRRYQERTSRFIPWIPKKG
jgi:steroid 5-alpha reductase family enzyme